MKTPHQLLAQKQKLEAEWTQEFLANGAVSLGCVRIKEQITSVEREMRRQDDLTGGFVAEHTYSIAT